MPQFPIRPMRVHIAEDGCRIVAFDTNKDRKADYRQKANLDGRKVELHFAATKKQPEQTVFLGDTDNLDVPHFIVALDGVPYHLVNELYEQGCFRLFYRPSRMVSSFPGMTDLAFQRVFGGKKPIGYQATHFDRQKRRIINGNNLYLSGDAADWANRLDYRCSFKWDAVAYLNPEMVFDHELRGMMKVFRQAKTGTRIAYSVGSAGLGTRGGREAILGYLRTIDQLCEQIVYERRGMVRITLLADHGHSMSGRGRITFEKILAEGGYRLTDKLAKPGDVASVEFGLVTYAAFFTDDPAGVAKVLLHDPATTVASYRQGDKVIVETLEGKAAIRKSNSGYSYTIEYGDPLELADIIKQLAKNGKVDDDGFIEDRVMFAASINHKYPDPLYRVWDAFDTLVQTPADLIVCLKDGWVHGSGFFHVMIGGASSTHGSLNQLNSMTFAMTMLGELPPALRLEDLMPEVEKLYGKKFLDASGTRH